jgi:hypothetical protein
MLFAVTYTYAEDLSEEKQKRVVQVFTNWTPPAGFAIKSHHELADGSGGALMVEVSTPAALYEATAAFTPFCHFRVAPVLDITESVPIEMKVLAWRDSVR